MTFLLAKQLLGFMCDPRAFVIAFRERAAGVPCPPDHSEESLNPFEDVGAELTPRLWALEIHLPRVALFVFTFLWLMVLTVSINRIASSFDWKSSGKGVDS